MKPDRVFFPFEIKKTAKPKKEDVESFGILESFGEKIGKGKLLCFVDKVIPLTNSVDAVPVSIFPRAALEKIPTKIRKVLESQESELFVVSDESLVRESLGIV